ncbi:HlyD family secretion protein [Aquamicrobium soli]|jgi:HlyD family secretion protein|uniref:HlyD family secretion protein n=1 Tax=Aquamicrobium soli TaxID=1811518 RepID=A0ABV7KJ90_9HYPH
MRRLGWLLAILVIAALGVLLWFATRPPPLVVQGEVAANRIDVSARAAGKVARLSADVGDDVEADAVLVELESPELKAALAAAEASVAVARADLARVESTRPETIAAQKAEVAAAEADVQLYQEAYNRQAQLVRSGSTPQAQVDQAARNLEAALRKREASQAQLALAQAGASPQERALAAAQVKQAEAALGQRQADIGQLTVRSPVAAQVTTRVAEMGENYGAGSPLFSLVDMTNLWFTFNLREDLLGGLKVGDSLTVSVPALKRDDVKVRVTMINVQGQYATWRATRATGGFDLRTFEVRATPEEKLDGLRPGMSVVAEWPRQGN